MRNSTLYSLLASAILAMGLASCESFLDVNENPNNPEDAPITGLLTNSTFETALNVQRVGSITSNYVQYLASPNPSTGSDIMDQLDYSATWFNLYNVMTDANEIIRKAEESEASHYLGAGKVLMALNLGMTVDIFGDVPFSQSFNFETVTPTYDDDQQLYTQILSLLDEALNHFQQESSISIGADDFIFEGDINKWIRFTHTLKARYLLHMKGKPGYDEAELLASVEAGMMSNEDDAQVFFFEQRFNPWAQVAINNASLLLGGWISEQFIQALDGTSYPTFDPRLQLMVGATDSGEYIGVVNGAGRGEAPEQGARSTLIPGQFYTSEQSPVLIATYAELKFIEAEAALVIDPERAYEAYLAGITAHMEMLGVPADQKTAYLADESVSMGANSLTLDDIMKEKYVAMFLHPETWNDARRFDYGYKNMTLPENLNPSLNGNYIRRLAYPDSEVSRNGNNVPQVTLLDRIWWND